MLILNENQYKYMTKDILLQYQYGKLGNLVPEMILVCHSTPVNSKSSRERIQKRAQDRAEERKFKKKLKIGRSEEEPL